MPWIWKRRTFLGCCIYCHEEYKIINYINAGPTWCSCPQAVAEKRRRKNEFNKQWYARKQAREGKVVMKRVSRGKPKPSVLKRRQEVTGVYIRPKINLCKVCHTPTVNRWYCNTHLEALSRGYDLDLIIETGCSRRLGTRVHG